MRHSPAAPITGAATVALALGFNLPYALLAARFDYPAILRQPPGEVLEAFAAQGPSLVVTWYAFALSALLLVPLAPALALRGDRLERAPALAIGAAIAGALSGLVQAMGLLRWVFVVPGLAAAHAAGVPAGAVLAAEQAFTVLNAYGGVAVGEHLGQLLLAGFVLAEAQLQAVGGARRLAALGRAVAAAIAIGTGEGLALVLGGPGEAFGLATVTGFLGLTAWLVLTGLGLWRRA